MLSAVPSLHSSPCPSPPSMDPPVSSVPSTPEDKVNTRQSSATPSDESSLFELSFEYNYDSEGNIIRVSNSKSLSSSPPEKHKLERRSSPKAATDRTSSDALPPPEPRTSLSRSESASVLPTGPSQATDAAIAGIRSFQRVASGPAVINAITPVATAAAIKSNLGALSTGLSNTARKLGGPRRVTKEKYFEQEERNKLADELLRAENQRALQEKGNLLNVQATAAPVLGASKRQSPPPLSRHSSTPLYPANSLASSNIDWLGSSGPSELAAGSSSLSRSRSEGAPGFQRPHIRKTASTRGAGRPWKGTFEDIAEHDGGEVHSADEYMGAETDTGEDPPPPNPPNGLSRGRSYGDVDEVNGANGLSSSTGVRPRRSFSVSDAPEPDHRQPQLPKPSRQYLLPSGRPETNGALNTSKGARRVTVEEHIRQSRLAEQEAEYLRRQRVQSEEYEIARESEPEESYGRSRKSPSPTHKNNHARSAFGHQRKDSDTLRSVPHPTLATASSPTAVDVLPPRLSPSGTGPKHRRSPTAPEPPTTSGMLAPAQNGKTPGRTWASGEGKGRYSAGDDDPADAIAENGYAEQYQVHEKRSTAAPSRPVPAVVNPVGERPKTITVNKKGYARLDLLGKGGSSRVYRVMTGQNDIYALKRVTLDQTDAETMSGYMNEIALLKRLEGNNRIIRLIDSEVKSGPNGSKGLLHLVMECGEIDLARLLQEQQTKPMNMVWIAYYWQQMLEAVQVIHDEKIVHSDLKPANFVLVRGQLKLIDFGIANAIANDTTNIQRDHQIGTVNYMSPEAIEVPDGKRRLKVGRPSDVWSLGCILYQMVYGYPPFQQLSVYQKMKAIPDPNYTIDFPAYSAPVIPASKSQRDGPSTPPQKLDHLKRRVPAYVIATMRNCLCRNPKERATIPELLEHDWLTGREPAPVLAHNESIINPHYMGQLLRYGMALARDSPNMTKQELEKLATDLIGQLQGTIRSAKDERDSF